jgi:two-component sensor histidine kinase
LNTDSDNLFEIFPKQYTPLFTQLLSEAENDIHSYTELTLGEDNNSKNYSINVVEIIHNNEKSQLVILRDITLQNEYNFQKHRAEIAEIANEKLQEEIERHKKTQEELLEKTSKLRAFNESAHSLFALTIDRDYRLTSVNTNFIKEVKILLEIEPKIGDLFLDLFKTDEEGVKAFHHKFEQTFKGDQQEIISHFPSNKGEYWVESFFYPILVEGEEIKEISIIAHDITERIEIQRQIKRSEASNRATLLAIPDFIFRLNSEGVFTDSRIRNGTLGALEQFVSTEDFTGKSINEIFLNEKIAREFTDNLKIALSGEGLHTQHFSFYVDENKRFFENRFSKINDEEVVVISRDITESMEYESRLIKSVREKEILLKEVHHRVKNNLQVINSILNLQSSYVDDPQTLEIINESQNRIRSMSYIHESLYQTKDFNSIDFYDYVTNLVQNLVHSYQMTGENIELDLDVERVSLALDQAIPCGLILNELISNALKYAYEPDDSNAIIQIGIKEKDRKVQVVVEDFGKGLPKDFNIYQTETLGLSLVESLVDQLDGELICKRERGTKFLIIFEKQEF